MPNFAGGGAERVIINIVNGFAEKGIFLDVIVMKATGPYRNYLSKEVKVVDLSQSSFIAKQKLWLLKTLTLGLPLAKHLRKQNICILLTSLHLSDIISLIVKKYFFKKIKVIVRIANTLSMQLSKNANLETRITANILKFLLPTADSVVAVSQGVAEDVKLHVPSISHLVHTVYNPVDSPHISRLASESLSHPWIEKQDYRIILTANRFNPQKDIKTLIQAFAKVVKSEISSRLIILGDGPEKPRLESLARQLNVHDFIDFVGFKNNPFAWMAKAQVFVLSSAYEGLPNVLIEAMACGTPVVSTDCPHGPREILQDGKFGRLVPVGDYKQLSFAILETLKNSIPSDLLIKRASDFSIESSVESHRKLFNSIADSHMLFSK